MAQRARSTWSKQQQQQQQKRKHQQQPFHESGKCPRTDPCDTPLDLHLLARSKDQSTLPVVHSAEASPSLLSSSSSSSIPSNKRQRAYSDCIRSLPEEKALESSLLAHPRPLSSSSSSSSKSRESRIDEATPLHGQCSEHPFHARPPVASSDFASEKQQQKQSRQTPSVPLQLRRRQQSPPPPLGVAPELQLDVNRGSNTAQLANHHLPPLSLKEEKERIRRERNRQSAASSRERRKKHVKLLEQRRVLLEEENRRLEWVCG